MTGETKTKNKGKEHRPGLLFRFFLALGRLARFLRIGRKKKPTYDIPKFKYPTD